MKILHLHFCNINSLAGSFSIDFEHPSLDDAGLFSITGPTGSGKSSLLDAISYALYGQTPRLGSFSNTRNDLMSRCADQCEAELVFENRGRRFRVSTSQRRTKRAKLPYAQAERRFSEIGPDGTEQLLATKIGDVNRLVRECSDLSYTNFCRCIMLPQGDFARFLKARDEDKSEVLATLTGTDVYRRLGDYVGDRLQELKRSIEALHVQEVLSEEDLAALREQKAASDAQCEALGRRRQELAERLRLREQYDALAAAEQESLKAHQQAASEQKLFEASGEAARLALGERAQAVQPAALRRHEASRLCVRLEGDLRRQQEALLAPQEELRRLSPALEQAESDCRRIQGEQAARRQLLEQELVPLEAEIRRQETAAHEAERRRSSDAAVLEQLKRREADLVQQQSKDEAALKRVETELSALGDLSGQRDALHALVGLAAQWRACTPDDRVLPLEEGPEDARRQMAALEGDLAQCCGSDTPEQLREREAGLRQLAEALPSLPPALEEDRSAQGGLKQAEERLSRAEAAEKEAEEAVQRARTIRELTSLRASVDDKLAELGARFRAGELPCCPCCGSPHPGPEPERTGQQSLREAEEGLSRADGALKAARAELKRAQGELRKASDRAQSSAAALKHCRKHLLSLLRDLAFDEPQGCLEQPEDFARRLADAQQALADRLLRIEALQARRRELTELLPALAARAVFREKASACTALVPGAELPRQADELKDWLERAESRLSAWDQAQEQHRQLRHNLQQGSEQLTRLRSGELRDAAANAEKSRNDAESARNQWQQSCSQRLERWGEETADKQLAACALACQKAEQLRDVTREKLESAKAKLGTVQQRIDDLTKQQREAREELGAADEALKHFLAEQQFDSEAAYAGALLSAEQLRALRGRQTQLARALAEAEAELRTRREALDPLRDRAKEPAPDALRAELASAVEALAEAEARQKELGNRLYHDEELRRDNRELEAQRRRLIEERDQWQLLYDTMGGTRDAFQRYAQSITMRLLVQQANGVLRRLSDRYTLSVDPDAPLRLSIRDCYLDDEPRPCDNLSGGESFLVSLALALGLSRMTGNTRFDTLFLDEGFGTLDEENLDRVLDSLQKLTADGKMVGIITHVDRLRDLIPTEIAVTPTSQPGYSTLSGLPAISAKPLYS